MLLDGHLKPPAPAPSNESHNMSKTDGVFFPSRFRRGPAVALLGPGLPFLSSDDTAILTRIPSRARGNKKEMTVSMLFLVPTSKSSRDYGCEDGRKDSRRLIPNLAPVWARRTREQNHEIRQMIKS